MKEFGIWCVFCFASLRAQGFPDLDVLNDFYDEFVCEEKNITSEVGVTNACTELPPPFPPAPQPLPPSPPEPMDGFLPVIFSNDSGRVAYFTIFGTEVERINCGAELCPISTKPQTFVNFGEQPGPFNSVGKIGGDAAPTTPSSTFSKKFTYQLEIGESRTVYVPTRLEGGEIVFSVDEPVNMHVSNNNIAVPAPADTSDPAFCQIYGQVELTLYPPNCQDPQNPVAPLNPLSVDVTNVDYFGLPIQFNLLSKEQNVNDLAGVFFGRAVVLQSLRDAFNSAATIETKTLWNSLIIDSSVAPCSSPGKILRVLSPGTSMFGRPSSPIFDINYFDNKAAYGYTWAENVWTGPNAYFKTNYLTITTTKNTFTGKINAAGEFLFFSPTGGGYTIPWRTDSDVDKATSASIFNVSTRFPGMKYLKENGAPIEDFGPDTEEITKILSSVIVAGIIPGRIDKIAGSGPPNAVINTYYLPNTDLPEKGADYGPWFDLYSVGLIGAGTEITGNVVYAYPYDDYLYAQSPRLRNVAPSLAKITPDTYLVIKINEYSDN